MNIGVLKEDFRREGRVALIPATVKALVTRGHAVFVENGAGEKSRFANEDYVKQGATIVYSPDEIFGRSDIVLKVAPPVREEYEKMRPGQIIFAAFGLPIVRRELVESLLEKQITAFGYEVIQEDDGSLPILLPMSEIAGQLSIISASHFLQSNYGGRGVLLGGVAGVPSATVVILGAGVAGTCAARTAIGLGAQVIMLDKNINRLRRINDLFERRVITVVSNRYNIEKAVRFADVLIGVIMVQGRRSPTLVTREMVRQMRPKSIIIDISIDEGGCVETSRPITIYDEPYLEENVLHYPVPNMPAMVSRTATYALSNAFLGYLIELVENGLKGALQKNTALRRGVYTYKGFLVKESLARSFELPFREIEKLLAERD